MERVSIESFLQHPLSPSEEKENSVLKTIQGETRGREGGREGGREEDKEEGRKKGEGR